LENRARLEGLLSKHDVDYELVITKSEAHMRELILSRSPNAKSIIGTGGDSTMTIIADEIIQKKLRTPMGILPLGSSDDIALHHNLFKLDDAVRAIARHEPRLVDAGCISINRVIDNNIKNNNGNNINSGKTILTYYLGQANLGIGVAVNRYVAAQSSGRNIRTFNQTLMGLKGISNAYAKKLVPQKFRIQHHEEDWEGEFVSLLFSKIKYWATGKLYIPRAIEDDGNLHAILMAKCSRSRLLYYTLLSGSGSHIEKKGIKSVSAAEFKVQSNRPFQIQVDGDILMKNGVEMNFNEVWFTAKPSAIHLLV